MKKLILIALCLALVCHNAAAQFSGSGGGTADDPYRIFNAEQLNQVRNFLSRSDVCFSLEANIDLSGWIAENNPQQGWQPIGTTAASFQGTFRGNGHTIRNPMINRPASDFVGLFGVARSSCNISDVHIRQSNIKAGNRVGGLVGYLLIAEESENSIDSCSFQGTISGQDNIGGIVGYADMNTSNYFDPPSLTLSFCSFRGTIDGHDNIGGIIGCYYSYSYQNSTFFNINNCYAEGALYANNYCGGIAGYLQRYNESTNVHSIRNSYAHFNIKAQKYIGGIAGGAIYSHHNSPLHLINNYSSGTIEGIQYIGGIVGSNESYRSNLEIKKCYSRYDKLIGLNNTGGIIGYSENGSRISSNIALNALLAADSLLYRLGPENMTGCATGTSTENRAWVLTELILNDTIQPCPEDGIAHGTNTGLSALRLKATYQGLGWDFDTDWAIQENECFPYLKTQTAPPHFAQEPKAGDTRLEGNCREAGTVSVRVGGKTYEAQSSGSAWSIGVDTLQSGEKVEISVQAEGKQPSYVVTAVVSYPGSGTEEDPYLISTAEELQRISEEGCYRLTRDLDLSARPDGDSPAEGWTPIGGRGPALAVTLDGGGHTLSGLRCNPDYPDCGLFAKIVPGGAVRDLHVILADGNEYAATSRFGGIAGLNKGLISRCEVTGTAKGAARSGGIAGENHGTIERCHTAGSLSSTAADATVGGITGLSAGGNILDCYSDLSVSSALYGGGIAGYNRGLISRCYASGHIGGGYVGGLVGYHSGADAAVRQCFALAPAIEATRVGTRVLGGFASDSQAPGMDNYAAEQTRVTVDGRPQTLYDDPMNGTALPENTLREKAAYEAAGWDMGQVWKIDEGSSYPYQEAFDVPVASLTLDRSEARMEAGSSLSLAATLLPANARNQTLAWKSSDERVATVDNAGTVKATGRGTATVTASTCDGTGLSAACRIEVTPRLATSISLDRERLEMTAGTSETLIATLLPEEAEERRIAWSSSNAEVATVDSGGTVAALTAGETVITATTCDGTGLSDSCLVVVSYPTGLESIPSATVSIKTEGGKIHIQGLNGDTPVTVSTLDGICLYQGTEKTISLPGAGVYLVRVNGITYKIHIP